MDKYANRSVLGGIFVGILASEALYYAVKWLRMAFSSEEDVAVERKDTFQTVVFFPDSKPSCKAHYLTPVGCMDKRCKYAHEGTAFLQLLDHLTSCRHSVDLCVYSITSRELGDVILQLHSLGIRVRVITDGDQADSRGSQIGKFRASGIQVRQGEKQFYMHHKFVIVDKKLLINGSFNWTRAAILGNNENLLITNNQSVTSAFLEEFDKLWEKYDPLKMTEVPAS